MMTILITGVSGFVAKHFLNYIDSLEIKINVIGIYNKALPNLPIYKNINLQNIQCNLLDAESIKKIIAECKPTHILHLAAQSSVGVSWDKPVETIAGNLTCFINICEAIKNTNCRLLSIGSAEVYGNVNSINPIKETANLLPNNPYGIAKLTQENIMQLYVNAYNMDIVGTRAFNHIGIGQNLNFAIPSFANQIMQQIKEGKKTIDLQVGNIEIVRDFLDVRDVAKAYYQLLIDGKKSNIYNVCSGIGTSIHQLILMMADIKNIDLKITINPNRIRPNETKCLIGDATLLKNEIKWNPTFTIKETLSSIFNELSQSN